jgi:two-component system, cell cycle sensor histidine kinase and response regulator CckA
MGVENAIISLYVEDDRSRLAPFLCLRDGQVFEPVEPDYQATELFPPGAWPHDVRRTSFVLPLTADARQIGVAVFEFTSGLRVHDMLCEQIGGAIHTARLHRQIVQQTTLHERALQERRAAADRMKSLSVLAGGVAHDLNNALGPLLALPSVIAKELSSDDGADTLDRHQLQADLMTIQSAALRASQTIKDLLTLGRQGRTQQLPVDLNQAIQSWQSSALPGGDLGSSVVIQLELERAPLVIKASEAHVTRALANLVRNAIEAVDGVGLVRISTRLAHISDPHLGYEVVTPGKYAVLSVADTGKGITRELLGRLFEPFVTTKRVSGTSGSGLGLAVVHGVVKEHGGFIDVDTQLGRGTTFSLYFPLTAEAPRRVAPISTPPRGQGRLLVVDDDPVQLTTTRRVLTHLGYEVTTLSSGEKAFELLSGGSRGRAVALANEERQSGFDILLLDMMLNEAADGLDLLGRILQLFPSQRAIITSGHAPDARVRLAVERGLVWLTKPYTVNALAKAVQGLLGSEGEEPVTNPAAPAHSFTTMLRTGSGSLFRSKAAGSDGGKRRS